MITVWRWALVFSAIGLIYESSLAAQNNASPVRSGETIEMSTYVVTAPVGDGWTVQKDLVKGVCLFQRQDTQTTIGVFPYSLPNPNRTVDEEQVTTMVFDSEEKNMGARGSSRSYAASDFSREVAVVSGRSLHVMRYSVTQLGLSAPLNPLVMRYAMYLYFPERWKESNRWYAFVVGAPQQIARMMTTSPKLDEIEPVIASFKPR